MNGSEGCLLRMLRLLIDGLNTNIIEIHNDLTIAAHRMLVKDVFDKGTIFRLISIPQTPQNLAASSFYAEMPVTFLVSSCTRIFIVPFTQILGKSLKM